MRTHALACLAVVCLIPARAAGESQADHTVAYVGIGTLALGLGGLGAAAAYGVRARSTTDRASSREISQLEAARLDAVASEQTDRANALILVGGAVTLAGGVLLTVGLLTAEPEVPTIYVAPVDGGVIASVSLGF